MSRKSLIEILELDLKIHVVDIGASYIEGEGAAVYKNLLDSGNAEVIGFEPSPEPLTDLQKNRGPNEKYLPYAIADGNEHTLKVCQAPGMSSILEPDPLVLNCFHGFPAWGQVINRIPLETRRLDDIDEIREMDFLKIDIQGAELLALENATEKLKACLVAHVEVEFLPMYKDQPLFGDIFNFMLSQGFVFHTFFQEAKRMVVPLAKSKNIFAGLNQLLWADAVFIRDFTNPASQMSTSQMLKYAVILHDIYNSYDVALRALLAVDTESRNDYVQRYKGYLEGQDPHRAVPSHPGLR